MNDQNEMIRDV